MQELSEHVAFFDFDAISSFPGLGLEALGAREACRKPRRCRVPRAGPLLPRRRTEIGGMLLCFCFCRLGRLVCDTAWEVGSRRRTGEKHCYTSHNEDQRGIPQTSSSRGKLGCDVVAEGAEPRQTKRHDPVRSQHAFFPQATHGRQP